MNKHRKVISQNTIKANLQLLADINGEGLKSFINRFNCTAYNEKSLEFYDAKEMNEIINNQLTKNKMATLPKKSNGSASAKPQQKQNDFDNTNKGVLFENDKQGNEKRPDYRGNININGVEHKIAAWVKTPKSGGADFLTISVEVPQDEAYN